MSNTYPLRADVVGSYLRPTFLKQARQEFSAGRLSQVQLTSVEDQAIKQLIEAQLEVGLKVITDGEFRRSWWHFDFLEALIGIEGYIPNEGLPFKNIQVRKYNIRITDKIRFNPHHPFIEHFKKLNQWVAGRGIAKFTLPSPNQLLYPAIWDIQNVYTDRNTFARDVQQAYIETVQALYNEGCRYLQIDDVYWGSLCEREPSEALEEDKDLAARNVQAIIEAKPKDLTLTTHVCRGNYRSAWRYAGSYDVVADALFGKTDFDGYFLEYDNERSGGFEPLQHFKGKGRIVLGLLTSKTDQLEETEQIQARIQEATKYVPLEQLCLSTQCGFASTEEGNNLTEDQQWQKIKKVMEIAQSIWKDA